MSRLFRAWCLCSLLGLASAGAGFGAEKAAQSSSEESPPLDRVTAERAVFLEGWDGRRFAASDRRGRLHLLRLESMEVYSLGEDLRLGEPSKLPTGGGLRGPAEYIRWAAMGDDSSEWLLLSRGLKHFDDEKVTVLDKPNQPILAVFFADGDPIALLGAYRLRQQRGEVFEELPTLMEWTGRKWSSRLDESVVELEVPYGPQGSVARRAFVAADGDRLWMAQMYVPRLRSITSAGKVRLDLVTDGGEPVAREDAAIESTRDALKDEAPPATRADREPASRSVLVMEHRPFHRGLAIGRDGFPYMLADPEEEGLRLRRWNAVEQRLEEIELVADLPIALSMAFDRSGLYLVPIKATLPAYFVAEEDLASAAWRPVEDIGE